jgi:hypothetical protein
MASTCPAESLLAELRPRHVEGRYGRRKMNFLGRGPGNPFLPKKGSPGNSSKKTFLLPSWNGKGQECYITCPLDGCSQLSLMFRAVTRDSSRDDLPAFGDECAEDIGLFVVHPDRGVRAETADFGSGKRSSLRRLGHVTPPPFLIPGQGAGSLTRQAPVLRSRPRGSIRQRLEWLALPIRSPAVPRSLEV